MRKTFLTIALGIAASSTLPTGAAAQADSASRSEVGGTVYDSLAHAPLGGAQVQMIERAHPEAIYSATSDAKGRYVIGALAPGSYLIGFQHVRLDSLGLEMPTRMVEIRAHERAKADLAIPSSASINTVACGRSGASDSTGLVIGILSDARTGEVFVTGAVQASWQEIVLQKGRLDTRDQHVSATVSPTGWFALCGVPAGIDVLARAFRGADSSGFVTMNVPIAGLTRRDFRIGGTASIHGIVRNDRQSPLRHAKIAVGGTDRATFSDSSGTFHLTGIPAGSQTIELRALGYMPETRAVELTPDSDTSFTVALTSVQRVLDTIQVVATRLYNADGNGFLKRKRRGFGTFIDEEEIARRKAIDLYSMLFTVPTVRITHSGFGRSITMRGISGQCVPALFLNGARMTSDLLEDLDLLARPEEIGGIEVYSAGNAPAEFYSFEGCGSVVIWTRPPVPTGKQN